MEIKVMGKNIEVTQALKNVVESKMSRLDKYFNPEIKAHVTLWVQKNKHGIEVTIPFNGIILRGEEKSEDMYASIDLVMDKLEKQIRKQKTKLQRINRGDSLRYKSIPDMPNIKEENENKIVKNKKFLMKPMSSEEAVLQMELLGHDFFVYENASTSEINVLYKRKDGNYGNIEPELL